MDHLMDCKDCDLTFQTAKQFSDHFVRAEGGFRIIGCKSLEQIVAEIKADDPEIS